MALSGCLDCAEIQSNGFTRQGSLVRTQHRPPSNQAFSILQQVASVFPDALRVQRVLFQAYPIKNRTVHRDLQKLECVDDPASAPIGGSR